LTAAVEGSRSAREVRRLAYLSWSKGLGGGEILLVNQLAHLDRVAFDPIVVASGEGALARRLRDLGIPVFLLPLDEARAWLGRLSLPRAATLARLVRLLRRERVQLIHSFTLETRNYAHAASLLTGLPVIHTSQDTGFGADFGSVQWWALNHLAARIIATSETVLQSLRVGTRLDPQRTVKIHPGVDLARFAPHPSALSVREEFGLPADALLVGVVGRLNSDVKGFPTLFAAAARIAARCPRARFLIVGDAALPGDDAARVKAQVVGTALERHLVWTGFRDDVARLVSALDVLVSASPRESFGLVLAEAAACSRPVVTTRSGGAEEIVVDGVTGLLVPVAAPDTLAEAVLGLLADRERALAMGRAARRHAEAHFDVVRMVRRVEAEYRAVLGPAPRAALGAGAGR
jgi:glycosyltransferase involved in cell wall biosynthesis